MISETIREHLKRQEGKRECSEEKVAKFIEARARELEIKDAAQKSR
jgi:hypothetical protein